MTPVQASPKRALFTGVTGVTGVTSQGGAYLAGFLLKAGCELHGSERRAG